MVTSISSVSTGNQIHAMDKVTQEQLYSPGLYAMKQYIAEEERKPYKEEHGFLRFLGKIVLAAVAVCGGAVAAKKWVPQVRDAKLIKDLPADAKFKETAFSRIKQFGDWIENGFRNLFSKVKSSDNKTPIPEGDK